MSTLDGTPYTGSEAIYRVFEERLAQLDVRMSRLRTQGLLSPETLKRYYGLKRFEQIAESNAIEGSPLTVRETQLAVEKGITISEHSPQYSEDARALDRAHQKLAELATENRAVDNGQLNEIHALLMGGQERAGMFRSQPVRISGSAHVPPKTREAVLNSMGDWQSWSIANAALPAPLRAVILHAWLTHVHPFEDGNGRTARAIGNLELIRRGYPPIIIKKVERMRYYEALSASDDGDIGPFFELILDRCESALIGLEHAYTETTKVVQSIRDRQEQMLGIWNSAVDLLAKILEVQLGEAVAQAGGTCRLRRFESDLELEDYLELCSRRTIPRSWAFELCVEIPGFKPFAALAWIGHRSASMFHHLGQEGGPSLFWSLANPDKAPAWISDSEHVMFGHEISSRNGQGDDWVVYAGAQQYESLKSTELARKISESVLRAVL